MVAGLPVIGYTRTRVCDNRKTCHDPLPAHLVGSGFMRSRPRFFCVPGVRLGLKPHTLKDAHTFGFFSLTMPCRCRASEKAF
jgi:hypothetical protein